LNDVKRRDDVEFPLMGGGEIVQRALKKERLFAEEMAIKRGRWFQPAGIDASPAKITHQLSTAATDVEKRYPFDRCKPRHPAQKFAEVFLICPIGREITQIDILK